MKHKLTKHTRYTMTGNTLIVECREVIEQVDSRPDKKLGLVTDYAYLIALVIVNCAKELAQILF